jgi:hypothetical protein
VIGDVEILSTDYVLYDPTNEEISAAIRAYDDGQGGYRLVLLRADGENPYSEELEQILDGMKPGDSNGFPREEVEYAGFARPSGATIAYDVDMTEYIRGGEKHSGSMKYWDFVRETTDGPPMYFFEMNKKDGYFYALAGDTLDSKQVRAFRY